MRLVLIDIKATSGAVVPVAVERYCKHKYKISVWCGNIRVVRNLNLVRLRLIDEKPPIRDKGLCARRC